MKEKGSQLISIWVQAPMVLMHLGLTDGPFVPHNLLSAHCSLLKFYMVPRLNF